jgi:hypothetical protein
LIFFGAKDGAERTHQVHTKAELKEVLRLPQFGNPKGIHVSHLVPGMEFPFDLSLLEIMVGLQLINFLPKVGSGNSHRQDGFPMVKHT